MWLDLQAGSSQAVPRLPPRGAAIMAALAMILVCTLGCQPAAPAPSKPAAAAQAAGAAPNVGGSAPAAAPAAAQPAPAPPRQLTIGYAAVNPRVTPLWLAVDEGFFARYGLEVEPISARNAAALQAAMVTGEMQMAQGGLSASLQARAAGADVVMLGGLIDKAIAHLVAHPSIRRPEDLRGKRLGVQSIGGTVWVRGMLALDKLGLEPTRDNVSVLVIGDEPTMAQALYAGAIDAAPIGPTFTGPLREQNYTMWDLAELGVPEVGQAFLTTSGLIQTEPDTVERGLRAIAEAVAFMKSMPRDPARRERVLAVAARYLRVAPEDTAAEMDAFVPLMPQNLLLGRDAMEAVYAVTLRENPELAKISLDSVVDDSILRRLEREGFFQRLYATP